MIQDEFNNTITTDHLITVEGINRFAHSYLAYKNDFTIIFEVLRNDPECFLANVHAAIFCILMHTTSGHEQAQRYLEHARLNLNKVTPREKHYYQAVQDVYEGKIESAIQIHQQLAQQYQGEQT